MRKLHSNATKDDSDFKELGMIFADLGITGVASTESGIREGAVGKK